MEKQKIDKRIQQNLFSTNNQVVISAINEIKERGNRLYLPLLFELLNSAPENDIEKEILNVLGSVKEKDTINSFMRAIEDDRLKAIRKQLLTACWQNGLDFSTFVPVFIDQVINEDWETAFEAFTVIDNLEYLPSDAIINVSVEKINLAMPNADEQKKYFLKEILVKLHTVEE